MVARRARLAGLKQASLTSHVTTASYYPPGMG